MMLAVQQVAEWYGTNVVHPMGVAAVIFFGLAMLILPRRMAPISLVAMACFVSPAQRLVVFGFDFNFIRIMVLFAFVRIVLRREWSGLRWKAIDTFFVLWMTSITVAFTLLHQTTAAFVWRLGAAFDGLGMYFMFRFLIRDWRDLEANTVGIVLISIPVAFCFLVEYTTQRNLFAFLGGVPEITVMRHGRLRCQGPFIHPILAGSFWAAMMPLMGALYFRGGIKKLLSLAGLFSAVIIIFACASSTPVAAMMAGCLGAACFFIRYWLKVIRWGFFFSLVCLHFVLEGPVWSLIVKFSFVAGSTGWHRYFLIDNTVNRFHEWWLLGVKSTAHWGYGMTDITSYYVFHCVRGGLLTLLLFLGVLILAYRSAGKLWRQNRQHRSRLAFSWALGTALFVHTATFFAVSYFGLQIIVPWYLTLGAIAGLVDVKPPARAAAVARAGRSRIPRNAGFVRRPVLAGTSMEETGPG